MPIITKQELEDAAVDAKTLEDVANGAADFAGTGEVTARLGSKIKTLAKMVLDINTNSESLLAPIYYGTTGELTSALPGLSLGQAVINGEAEEFGFVYDNGGANAFGVALGTNALQAAIRSQFEKQQIAAKHGTPWFTSAVTANYNGNALHYLLTANTGDYRQRFTFDRDDYPNGAVVGFKLYSGVVPSIISRAWVEQESGGAEVGTRLPLVVNGDFVYCAFDYDDISASTDRLELNIRMNDTGVNAVISSGMLYKPEQFPIYADYAKDNMLSLLESERQLRQNKEPSANLASVIGISHIVGSGVTSSGLSFTVPAGVYGGVELSPEGLQLGDTITIAAYVSQMPAKSWVRAPNGQSGGGTGTNALTSELVGAVYDENWAETRYLCLFTATNVQTGNAFQPENLYLLFDQRSAPEIRCEILYYTRSTRVPLAMAQTLQLKEALKASGLPVVVFVDQFDGNDANNGSFNDPVASLSRAQELNATDIALRAGRHQGTLTFTGGDRISVRTYRKTGDDGDRASVRCSSQLVLADFTDNGDGRYYYDGLSAAPTALFCDTGAGFRRFGEIQPDGLSVRDDYAQMSANADALLSGAGRWFWDDTADRLWVRPTDDTWANTTFEAPQSNGALIASNVNLLTLQGVEFGFGLSNSVAVSAITVYATDCRIGYSGDSDGLNLGVDVNWFGKNNEYTEAGDDGVNTIGSVYAVEENIYSHHNVGDGYAPHQTDNYTKLVGGLINENGKQGFVTVADGSEEIWLENVTILDNASQDILVLLNGSSASKITMINTRGDANISSSGTITGLAVGHTGTITQGSGATINVVA